MVEWWSLFSYLLSSILGCLRASLKKKKKELPWAHDSSERKKEILKQRKSILIMCPEVPHVLFHIILVISIYHGMSFKEARLCFCHKEAQNLSGFSQQRFIYCIYTTHVSTMGCLRFCSEPSLPNLRAQDDSMCMLSNFSHV